MSATLSEKAGMKEKREDALLVFDNCQVALGQGTREMLALDFELLAGELLLISAGDAAHEGALADAACGLTQPIEGAVRFMGRNWQGLPPEYADALRGRIGATLSDEDWLPYLSILDNLLLPHLYHSRQPEAELLAEACKWAQHFGLPGVPGSLPSQCNREERRLAALVRAFLGSPLVIVIEERRISPPRELKSAVINAAGEVRQAGSGVLWLTDDPGFLRNRDMPASRRLQMIGNRLSELEAVT